MVAGARDGGRGAVDAGAERPGGLGAAEVVAVVFPGAERTGGLGGGVVLVPLPGVLANDDFIMMFGC